MPPLIGNQQQSLPRAIRYAEVVPAVVNLPPATSKPPCDARLNTQSFMPPAAVAAVHAEPFQRAM
jgi:hypothetical protein